MIIRRERLDDVEAVDDLIVSVFSTSANNDGCEPRIVRRLRKAGAITLALVAELDGIPIGHIVFSPIGIADGADGWLYLGPLTVHPDFQKNNIGTSLVLGGLELLKDDGASGVILIGDYVFYSHFGFRSEPQLNLIGVPFKNLLALPFRGESPKGAIAVHQAFFDAP